jgi:flagellar export protein FliJ
MVAKDLRSLIRLNEWMVDERRRELSDVLGSLEGLEKGLERLEKELELEQQAVLSSPNEAGLFYGNYASSVNQQRDHINAGILSMEKQVVEARARLDDSYRELKKFEITQDARNIKIAQEVNRQETIEMDEIALQVHRSKQD